MTSINLLDDVRSFIRPETLARFGDAVGESPEATARASQLGIAALLGGLAAHGQSEGGASRLFDLIRMRGYTDPDAYARTGAWPDDGLRREGSGLLDTIFGAKLVGATDGLARSAGISRGSMGGIMAMLAPLVMSVIGLRMREGGLDSRGLRAMLVGQTHHIRGLVPESVADQIGMTTLATTHVRAFTHEPPIMREPVPRRRVVEESQTRKTGWWLWPLFAAGLLILGLVLLLRGMGDRREARLDTPRVDVPTAPRVEAPRVELPAPPRIQMPRVEMPSVPEEGIEGLAAAMESRTENLPASFEIDELQFDHASTSLASGPTLDRIARLMKEHPQSCLEIDGHTDSTGPDDINGRLSQARANVVRNALIARGVNGERLESDGLGEQSPVATNDTVEGRERNRRTEVVLESCA